MRGPAAAPERRIFVLFEERLLRYSRVQNQIILLWRVFSLRRCVWMCCHSSDVVPPERSAAAGGSASVDRGPVHLRFYC
jgi:hypothetical protein